MTAPQRSDIVRAKRYQRKRSTSSRRQTKRRRTANPSVVPMVSRSGAMNIPRVQPRRKKTRKRFNLALNAAGAELRLPALPAMKVGWRAVSGLMIIALVWAIMSMWNSPQFKVTDVEVNGLSSVSQDELLSYLDILNKQVFSIDPEGLKGIMIKELRALLDVEVLVKYPALVIINVTERKPVLVWDQIGISFWWVDIDGMAFNPIGPNDGLVYVKAFDPPPPLLSLDKDEDDHEEDPLSDPPEEEKIIHLLSTDMVKAIIYLNAFAPEGATMIYEERHGVGWVDPAKNWTIYFGSELDDLPLRVTILQHILADLESKNRIPFMISVEYIDAPYYRMGPEEPVVIEEDANVEDIEEVEEAEQ